MNLFNYPNSARILTCYRNGFRVDYLNWEEWSMDAPDNIPVGSCVRIDGRGMKIKPFCAIEWTYREGIYRLRGKDEYFQTTRLL